MIHKFTSHSANERTFLAWIRTAIALLTFGFIIEKFNIYLRYLVTLAGPKEVDIHPSLYADVVGLGIIVVAGMILATASIRFLMNKRAIDSQEPESYSSKRTNIFLGVMLFLVAVFFFIYLAQQMYNRYLN